MDRSAAAAGEGSRESSLVTHQLWEGGGGRLLALIISTRASKSEAHLVLPYILMPAGSS